MAWFIVAAVVVSFAVSYSLQPKPESRPPAGIEEVTAPSAEIGREIPVLFGRRKMEGPNVVWYGDLRSVAVKKKGGKK